MQPSPMIQVPKDTLEFIQRWQRKRRLYKLDRLEHYFDRFFTSFVLYNFLYDTICIRLQLNLDRDKEMATKAAKEHLGANAIFNDPMIRENADKIRVLIESSTFYIRNQVWDAQRIQKLTPRDPELWVEGLLEIMYGIRCNTFHGQKSFEESQKAILDPCIAVVERLSDMIIETMHDSV